MEKREFKDDLTDTWFKLGIVFGVCIVAVIIPVFIFFGDFLTKGGMKCGFLMITHLYCPGCGGTRSVYHLIHGHFIKSFLCHPFVPYTFVDYTFFMINTILVKTTKKLGFTGFPITYSIYVGIAVLLGQWIIRNILYLGWGITCL
ncbi:MAG: DUF2752 domain-containing protein [Lachnospiraceae bacterium]|nr:DUF2752 domain-containing protein [Lachnospiraceae bacterium]